MPAKPPKHEKKGAKQITPWQWVGLAAMLAPLLGHLGQAASLADGEGGELDDGSGAAQRREGAAVLAGDGDGAATLVGAELDEAHDQIHPPSTT